MKTRSKYALSAFAVATMLVTTVAVAPAAGQAEESVKAKTLAKIDANLDGLSQQISEIGGQISDVDSEIAELEAEYRKLQQENEELLREIMSYMKDDYVVTASSTTLDSLVTSQKLSDLASAEQYRNNATDVVQEKFEQYIDRAGEIEDLLAEAKEKRQGLLDLKGQLDQRKATVEAQEQARQAAAALSEQKLREAQEQHEQAEAVSIASNSGATSAPSGGGGSVAPIGGGNNPYPYGQCTWYVYSVTGRGQNGNAGTWGATSSTPAVGKIMIWAPGEQGAAGAGHVGVVIGVSGSNVTVRHMNWNGWAVVSTGTYRSTGKFY